MFYVILIGTILAVALVAAFALRRPRPAGSDLGTDRTSTDRRLPGPDAARRMGDVEAPPGSQPDREAHGKP